MKGILFLDKSQTPKISAYKEVFEYMDETYSDLIVVLNDPYYKFSDQNLLTAEITEKLFKTYFGLTDRKCKIYILKDHPNNFLWSNNLDKIIFDSFRLDIEMNSDETSNLVEILFLNNNYFIKYDSFKCSKIHKNFDIEVPVSNFDYIKDYDSFFLGVQWADKKTYPAAIPTVDIALILNIKGRDNLVFGIKKDDPYHHLIGGFVDPTDDSYEDAAVRELSEEVNYFADKNDLVYITSEKINDWRYKNLKHNIITHLYAIYLNVNDSKIIERQLKACDDLVDIKLIPLNEIVGNDIVPHHRNLVNKVLNKYNF